MAKLNLDELRADREAGTDGPWRVRAGHRHDPEECNLHICGDIFVLADINGPNYSHQEPNARRIARLPDLEAAYLEAVELLEGWIEHAVACEDDSMELYSTRLFLDHNT